MSRNAKISKYWVGHQEPSALIYPSEFQLDKLLCAPSSYRARCNSSRHRSMLTKSGLWDSIVGADLKSQVISLIETHRLTWNDRRFADVAYSRVVKWCGTFSGSMCRTGTWKWMRTSIRYHLWKSQKSSSETSRPRHGWTTNYGKSNYVLAETSLWRNAGAWEPYS